MWSFAGKLTAAQISAGYAALKKVEDCLQHKDRKGLQAACSEFYTRIPHDFGFRNPPLINDKQTLKEKIQLLEVGWRIFQ